MLQTITIAPAGTLRDQGRTLWAGHLFSPQTTKTSHYWNASCVPRASYQGADIKTLAKAHVSGPSVPFSTEDLPMLEAQQDIIDDADFWSLKLFMLPSDAAAVRAGWVLNRLIAQQG